MTFIDTDRYEFDFIWSHGKQYVEITHHYNHKHHHGDWIGYTRFGVKIEDKIIQWDESHPISKEAISYINRVYKNKTFF